jgi:PAN domain
MGSRDLVPLPAPPPPRRPWSVGLLAFAAILLASALVLLAAHTFAPEILVTAAVSEPEPLSIPQASHEAVPILPPRSTVAAVAPRPRARPSPLPGPEAAKRPSTKGPVPAQGWLSGHEPSPPPGNAGAARVLVTYVNRDIDGSDYQVVRNQDLAACESRCRADGRCRAYTFNKWENVCFLKSSAMVTRIEPRGISGVLADDDVRTARRPPTIERLRTRRFPSEAYRILERTDYDGCARACAADALCLGFNLDKVDRSCALIASLDKTVPDNGTDAGMKWQAPVVASAAPRRRALPPPRDLPPEAAIIFGVVRQMMRY